MRRSKRIKSDRLSDLPDCVLLHIMKFLNLKAAVRTSVLSKRLKDLWKRLTDITLHSSDFRRLSVFTKCVFGSLISLHNIGVGCFQDFQKNGLVLINWLQLLANVKMMTLSRSTLKLLYDLLSPDSIRPQSPCFVRLKSLKLEMKPFPNIPDEGVSRILEYLLQNSSLTGVDIIKC